MGLLFDNGCYELIMGVLYLDRAMYGSLCVCVYTQLHGPGVLYGAPYLVVCVCLYTQNTLLKHTFQPVC